MGDDQMIRALNLQTLQRAVQFRQFGLQIWQTSLQNLQCGMQLLQATLQMLQEMAIRNWRLWRFALILI